MYISHFQKHSIDRLWDLRWLMKGGIFSIISFSDNTNSPIFVKAGDKNTRRFFRGLVKAIRELSKLGHIDTCKS